MGQYKAGVLITGIILYNILLYVIVSSMLGSLSFYGVTGSGIKIGNVGFNNVSQTYNVNSTISHTDDVSVGGFFDTISFITGVGTSSYYLNIPASVSWLVIILFWIPNIILILWALYMALPIIH